MHAALSGRTTFINLWISLFQMRLEIDEEYRFRIAYRIPGTYCTQKEACMESLANVLGQLTRKAVGIHPICIPLQPREIWYEVGMKGICQTRRSLFPNPFVNLAGIHYESLSIALKKTGGTAYQDVFCYRLGTRCRTLTCRNIASYQPKSLILVNFKLF